MGTFQTDFLGLIVWGSGGGGGGGGSGEGVSNFTFLEKALKLISLLLENDLKIPSR